LFGFTPSSKRRLEKKPGTGRVLISPARPGHLIPFQTGTSSKTDRYPDLLPQNTSPYNPCFAALSFEILASEVE
jgi:hypothetical protein